MERRSYPTLNALALADLAASLRSTSFWMTLAWSDILQRYRGSLIGPFWLTISSGVFIFGLGPLYASLFNLEVKKYLPFMAVGLLIWGFLTGVINESCRAMLDNASVMKQVKLPRTLFIFQIVARNFIIFLHTIPVYLVVFWYCDLHLSANMLLFFPGVILLLLNMFWIALFLSIVCARFRDVTQIVGSIIQLSFFVTPIIWNPATQHAPSWVVDLNPFYAFIQLLRAPLLSEMISWKVAAMALLCLVVGGAATTWLFVRARKQIVYWI